MSEFYISPGTRAKYPPTAGLLNISMDFNVAPSGTARGVEVVVPDNAPPEVWAAAERYNQQVAAFAARYGIQDYPIRGVRTRSENGRGVPYTIHTEPFFNTDLEFQRIVQENPVEFASIYTNAFSGIPNARLIAPHGVGNDRGAASDVFGDETSFGEFVANAALNGDVASEAMNTVFGEVQGPPMPQSAPAGRTAPRSTISARGPEPMAQEYQPERATGILGALFPKMTADRQDRIVMGLSGLSMFPNQAVVQGAQQRMGDRRDDRRAFEKKRQEQAQMNRTLQVLGQAGFDEQDLALAAENPEYMRAMVGQLAQRRLAGEQQPKWEWNSDLGQYVDMNDPTNTYAPQGAGTTPPTLDKDQMSILGGLSDDATRDLKTSEELRSSYNRIQSFADGQSVSDVALVTAFAKLLDPGSVVREGEAAAIAQSGSLPDAFKQSMLNALTGQGQLPPEVKQEIVSLSRKLYYDTASDARSTIEGYQNRAARAGLGGEQVYLGSDFTSPAQPQSSLRPQTRPGQFSAQQAGPTISREQLQSAVGKLSAYDRELLNSIPGAQAKLRFLQEKGVLP